jgi:hypothetical protein
MFVTSLPPLPQGSSSGRRLALHMAYDDEGVVDDVSLGRVFDILFGKTTTRRERLSQYGYKTNANIRRAR